jgi:menaquinone-9 beta-reductase
MKKADVIIIGGGPAGLSAGIVCGRLGFKTIILERKQLPREKACGEGLMPGGVKHLQALGAASYIQPGEYFPFTGIQYQNPDGTKATGLFENGAGWGISRKVLSRSLFQAASALTDVEIIEGAAALPLELSGRGTVVKMGREKACGALLIGADGLNSAVRRWAGLQGPAAKFFRWGASQHYHTAPWSSQVEVYWENGIEAYVTPLNAEMVGVALLWSPHSRQKLPGGEGFFSSLLAAFPGLQGRLTGRSISGTLHAVGPLQRNVSAAAREGVVLVGDAAGYLDAITGDGIRLALAEALELEKAVPDILVGGGDGSAAGYARYVQAHQRLQRPYLLFTRLALYLSQHPSARSLAVRLLFHYPRLFQRLLSVSSGN